MLRPQRDIVVICRQVQAYRQALQSSLIFRLGNRIIGTQEGKVVDLDMEEALAMTKVFDMERYRVLEATTTGAGD